jgi:hypothetical protein
MCFKNINDALQVHTATHCEKTDISFVDGMLAFTKACNDTPVQDQYLLPYEKIIEGKLVQVNTTSR